jgi:hypothetical protein
MRLLSTFIFLIAAACNAPLPSGPANLPVSRDICDCPPAPTVREACNGSSHVVYGVIESVEKREEPLVDRVRFETVEECQSIEPGIVMALRITDSWMADAPPLADKIEVVLSSVDFLTAGLAIDGETLVGGPPVLAVGTSVGMWISGPSDGLYESGWLFTIANSGEITYEKSCCESLYEANTKTELADALSRCPSEPPRRPLIVAVCQDPP